MVVYRAKGGLEYDSGYGKQALSVSVLSCCFAAEYSQVSEEECCLNRNLFLQAVICRMDINVNSPYSDYT